MIFVAIGANLPSERFGPPRAGCEAALTYMEAAGLEIVRRSRWYESDPVPVSDQPKYVNGVAEIATDLPPLEALDRLLEIEAEMGRVRGERNAARTIDLDLLTYHDEIMDTDRLKLPHPRMHERAFVLLPLAEIAPEWRHPASGTPVADLIAALAPDQQARPMAEPSPRGG